MKTINTILISGLVAFSLSNSAMAANVDAYTLEMNQILETRIDAKIQRINEVVNVELETSAETVKYQVLNNTASTLQPAADSKRS